MYEFGVKEWDKWDDACQLSAHQNLASVWCGGGQMSDTAPLCTDLVVQQQPQSKRFHQVPGSPR